MTELNLTLENNEGLHARPAAVLAKIAGQFQSKIEIKAKGQVKNAKSIMGLLSLGLEKGDEISIQIEGADEDAAIARLDSLFRAGFIEN